MGKCRSAVPVLLVLCFCLTLMAAEIIELLKEHGGTERRGIIHYPVP